MIKNEIKSLKKYLNNKENKLKFLKIVKEDLYKQLFLLVEHNNNKYVKILRINILKY